MFGAGEEFGYVVAGFIVDVVIGFDGFDGFDGLVELGYERANFGFGHCCCGLCLRL